jgi:hypothetical protein
MSTVEHARKIAENILLSQQIGVEMQRVGEKVASEIAKAITVVPPEPFKLVRTYPIPDAHQVKTVSAGKREEVFSFTVPKGNVAFVTFVGNSFWEGDYLYWWIDGRLIESPYMQRSLASINEPAKIEPWFRLQAYELIRWEAQNNDEYDHEYEVLQAGFYCKIEDVPLLFRLMPR